MHQFENNPRLQHRDSDLAAAENSTVPARLYTAAQKAGFAAGRAVNALRELQHKIRENVPSMESINERLVTASGKVQEQAGRLARESQRIGRLSFHEARYKTKEFAQDRPLYFIAGVATLSFSLGIALRLWRINRVDQT